MAKLTSKGEVLRAQLISLGQDHAWEHCASLKGDERAKFESALNALDFDSLEAAICMSSNAKACEEDTSPLKPPPYIATPGSGGDERAWEEASALGESLLSSGKVAALTVAGGQGTRLGLSGPKGCFGVTPVRQKSLFQLFSEKIIAAQKCYKSRFYWLIMTSQANSEQTTQFFHDNDFFGLEEEQVIFFEQGLFPSVDFEGKLILEAPGRLAMSPDGHGGTFDALAKSGSLGRLRAAGVEILSYFQVDNPLVCVLDPAFIGFHKKHGSSMSSKMVVKEDPSEKVGLFCEQGGVLGVAEYSDIPKNLAAERDATGGLTLRAGNIAVHLVDCDFAARIAEVHALPFHCARKAIPYLAENGQTIRPEAPNGTKFEKFIFDSLKFAQNPLILEAIRGDEFSPVKNTQGADSPDTSMRDQSLVFAGWFEAAGVSVPRNEAGEPLYRLEISPLFANDLGTFLERWGQLDPKPAIRADFYLE